MMSLNDETIRVGSRKSELALIQTKYVISKLQELYKNKKFEIHTMTTIGDRVLNISLPKIGEKSLFTRDLEDALRNGGVDFVVHSLKDLPTALPCGMAIGAVLEREDARDALVLRNNYNGHTLANLPSGCIIGTSSLRRTAQIRRKYPHLQVCDIRGNLNTRLAKLDAESSKFAGIILAYAGLVRMGWEKRINQILEPTELLYAVGQGALAVECRSNDDHILGMLKSLMCLSTTCRILAERSFLKTLGGGCSAPVAVWSSVNGEEIDSNGNSDAALSLVGAVWSLDGQTEIRDNVACSLFVGAGSKKLNKRASKAEIENPPHKRSCYNFTKDLNQSNVPIIKDEFEGVENDFTVQVLLEKHIDIANKYEENSIEFFKNTNLVIEGTDEERTRNYCPMKMEIGQDFMAKCPFVSTDKMVHIENNQRVSENELYEKDNNISPPIVKCPYSDIHEHKNIDYYMKNCNTSATVTTTKCPFFITTVETFDYPDDKKPSIRKFPLLIKGVGKDKILCGLYQHDCFNQELYSKCNKLGKTLAEEIIKRGALNVMQIAQTEIHSKV